MADNAFMLGGDPAPLYEGIYPPASTPTELISRSVQTVPIDNYGNPILQQVKANAVAQALSGPVGQGAGTAEIARALVAANGPNGQFNPNKSQDRLPANAFGYGENGMTGGWSAAPVAPTSALSAIEANSFSPGFNGDPLRQTAGIEAGIALPRPRPNTGGVFQQPDWTVANQGMGGITRDVRQGNNVQGRALAQQPISITVPGGNKTQQALAQVRMSAAPAVATQQAAGLSPSQAYAAANAQAAQTAIVNSSNPSANSARASLASQWGFD